MTGEVVRRAVPAGVRDGNAGRVLAPENVQPTHFEFAVLREDLE